MALYDAIDILFWYGQKMSFRTPKESKAKKKKHEIKWRKGKEKAKHVIGLYGVVVAIAVDCSRSIRTANECGQ